MNSYLLIKNVHILTVTLSLTGFLLRAWWRFNDPQKLALKSVRIVPHIIDTVLLLSAITLMVIVNQYPATQNWLGGKILFLLLYIVAGAVTLKTRFSNRTSLIALLVALTSFAMILFLAKHHNWSFLVLPT
ncbi:MAG: SirB2 family protein [Gammaproteobacteria bacterium]|nr:SirB2 family protein [Gammaproteobacteria bacterium]NNJ93103.1 SirB2 family protein [Gammaproteobacteria bacterium]